MVLVKPVIHGLGINPESERATVDQRPVVLRPIGDGVKRFTHDADLRGMVVLRSLGFQLVPFKLHRFRKQRRISNEAPKPQVGTVLIPLQSAEGQRQRQGRHQG
ncbi:hypothetical protein [Aeromonas salmonicida]|uniref:hypothetical protein n=1 Tax=Aeromonas salmonicida TaxID=645 RepID=UPI001F4D9545|nr:hypothetical protein [Aeromonas salmonicida]